MNVRLAFVTLISRFAIIQSQMQPADNETTKLFREIGFRQRDIQFEFHSWKWSICTSESSGLYPDQIEIFWSNGKFSVPQIPKKKNEKYSYESIRGIAE